MTPSSDPRNYARFIPKEELGQVSQWRFGAVGSDFSPEQLDQRRAEAEESRRQMLLAQEGAYLKGLDEGRAQAQEEAQRLCDAFVEDQGNAIAQRTAEQMAALISAMQHGLQRSEERLAQGVLDLACTIARQVVRHELTIDPMAVRHVVTEALGLIASDGKIATIRLNPQDMGLLQTRLQKEFEGRPLMFVADSLLAPGDCQVESAGAVVDGRLERRWAHAVSGLGLAEQASAHLDAGEADGI